MAFHAHSIAPVTEVELKILHSIVVATAKPCVLLPEGEPEQRTVVGTALALEQVIVTVLVMKKHVNLVEVEAGSVVPQIAHLMETVF